MQQQCTWLLYCCSIHKESKKYFGGCLVLTGNRKYYEQIVATHIKMCLSLMALSYWIPTSSKHFQDVGTVKGIFLVAVDPFYSTN